MARIPGRRAAGAWAAGIGVAALALVLVELARVPSLGAYGALVGSLAPALGPIALVLGLGALPVSRGRRLLALVVALALGALVHRTLADGPGFAWHPASFAVSGATALVAAVGVVAVATSSRARTGLGGGLALAGGGLAVGHHAVLVGLYPNVHAAALELAFVALTAGLAMLLAARQRAPVLALLVVLSLFAIAPFTPAADARPQVTATTELGRVAGVVDAMRRHADDLVPTAPPGRDPIVPDPDAEARFARCSGLPALPAGFDLRQHDVLLVLVDAARHDGLAHMPRLAALARESQRFDRAMSPSNGTFPSLAATLAMAPVFRTELELEPRFWRGRLREERETAPEAMRAAGRETWLVGHDHRHFFRDHVSGLDQGFDDVERIFQPRGPDGAEVDAAIADRAIARLRRPWHARSFGLVFFGSPHDDYVSHGGGVTTDRGRYHEELAYADAQLGRVLDAADPDTVVIVMGDHGEAFGEHGQRHHLSSMHDEQIHVPLVVRVPGLAPAVHAAPTSTLYVLPWLLLRGAAPERAAARRALTSDIGPTMRALDGAVLSEMIGPRAQQAAFVTSTHAVVYDVFADLARIYDSVHDPAQRTDLREARPALLSRWTQRVRRYRRLRFSARRFRFLGAPP